MNNKVKHIVANINAVDISNAILCVLEFYDNNPLPSNVFVIAQYDELEDEISTDFSLFDKLTVNHSLIDPIDQYLDITNSLENLYLKGHNILNVDIPVYQTIDYLCNNKGLSLCVEDFENSHLIQYVTDNFHIDFFNEQSLRLQAKNNPFSQVIFENYLENRQSKIGI